jgi:hypothetical protein
MNKQLSPQMAVIVVALVAVAVLGFGWYMINRQPGEIGPKPGAKTGFMHLGAKNQQQAGPMAANAPGGHIPQR